MKKLRPILLASLATGAIVLTQALLVTPTSASTLLPAVWKSSNPQLIVSGAIIEGDIVPGTNYTHTMTISTRSTDPPMDVLLM